jgi:hypothetical protein
MSRDRLLRNVTSSASPTRRCIYPDRSRSKGLRTYTSDVNQQSELELGPSNPSTDNCLGGSGMPIDLTNDDPEIKFSDDEDALDALGELDGGIVDLQAEGLMFGTEFEKVDTYDEYLDYPNPWHADLRRQLFPAQIIGFRWMANQHRLGGGIVGDCVGCGKVTEQILIADV